MKNRKVKQIAAIAAVILLAALYLLTLVAAIIDPSASGRWFAGCLVCTMAVPLLAWIFIWIYGEVTDRKTVADLHLMQDQEEKDNGAAQLSDEETVPPQDGESE